jgi:2-(1,2-epoxy-1,2-dihydrophenyl)acetyl-CoA isomerase
MSGDPVLVQRAGAVATLVLNRPDVGNAIDLSLAQALMNAAIACDEDAAIRCVVITGAGRMFCAGGDVAGFASAGDELPVMLKQLTSYLHMAVSRFARMNKPLVTAINGAAAGAGFSLAVLGDIALVARSAKLALAYGGIGLSPDGGATWLLPRLIGLRRAQELALTGQRLTGEEAAAMGLVTRAVDDAALMGEAETMAAKLARGATRALGRTRALLLSSFGNSLEEQLELESRAIAAGGRDAEGREGVAAFLAKRPPDFSV